MLAAYQSVLATLGEMIEQGRHGRPDPKSACGWFERAAEHGWILMAARWPDRIPEFMADKQPGNLIVANNLASLLLDRRTDKASLEVEAHAAGRLADPRSRSCRGGCGDRRAVRRGAIQSTM